MVKIWQFLHFLGKENFQQIINNIINMVKLNAPTSKPSSESLKLTIQNFWIENKELNEKVIEDQQELSKSFLKVLENLGEIIPPFMKLFGKKNVSNKIFIPKNLIPSTDSTIWLIIGSKVSISVWWYSIWWKIWCQHTYPSKQASSWGS